MITPKKIYQFIEGNLKMLGDTFNLLPDHEKEQVTVRLDICKNDCVKLGYCIYCGCDLPGKMYVKSSCNGGERFPDLMKRDDWEIYKAQNNIIVNGNK
jgi:hypothetical protein